MDPGRRDWPDQVRKIFKGFQKIKGLVEMTLLLVRRDWSVKKISFLNLKVKL